METDHEPVDLNALEYVNIINVMPCVLCMNDMTEIDSKYCKVSFKAKSCVSLTRLSSSPNPVLPISCFCFD